MSDRPTPEPDGLYCPEIGWTGVVPIDHARTIKRQRDAYAETLMDIARGQYCGGVTTFIWTSHPELAENSPALPPEVGSGAG